MKTTVQKISPTQVKLTVKLDEKEIKDGEQVALAKLSKEVKASGFRKGKVPPSVAVKHIDAQKLALEGADNSISKAVAEAFMSEKLQALKRPEVEVTKFEPGKVLEFTAETEIIPEIKLGDYKKLKIPKQDESAVGKPQVDEVLSRIQNQMAEKKTVIRAAKQDDSLTLDFVGKKDGVAFDGGTATDHEIVIGSKSFIEGFEDGLIGHKTGDEFTLDLVFPKQYRVEDLAGAKVTFDVTVKKIDEMAKPEVTDEFAAKVGKYTSAKELKDDIKKELTAQAENERNTAVQDELVKQLVEKSDVPVPNVLIEDQIASLEKDITQNLTYQGTTFEQYLEQNGHKTKQDWIEKEAKPAAQTRVKTGLVLSELSKIEKVTATNQELAERVEAMKGEYSNQPEMTKRFDEPEVQRDLANRLLTEKTLSKLVELNTKK